MPVGVPDGDLGEPPDPAVPRVQIGWAEPGDQPDDDVSAAVQVRPRVRLAEQARRGVLRVQPVDDLGETAGSRPARTSRIQPARYS